MRKYNISKPEKYLKDGQEKTFWVNCGTMTEFEKQDGSISRIIEIPAISLKANVFPMEPKETSYPAYQVPKPQRTQTEEIDTVEYPPDEIDPKDIPF